MMLRFFPSHFFLPSSGGSSGCLLIFLEHFFELNQFINLLFFLVSLIFQSDKGQVRHYNSGRSADQWRTGEGRRIRKGGSWEMLTECPYFGSGKLLIQNYIYAVVWNHNFLVQMRTAIPCLLSYSAFLRILLKIPIQQFFT